jgi:hypothetical protein
LTVSGFSQKNMVYTHGYGVAPLEAAAVVPVKLRSSPPATERQEATPTGQSPEKLISQGSGAMSKELSVALVQDDAVASPEEFAHRMRSLVLQYPGTSMFVFPEQHLLGAWDP